MSILLFVGIDVKWQIFSLHHRVKISSFRGENMEKMVNYKPLDFHSPVYIYFQGPTMG